MFCTHHSNADVRVGVLQPVADCAQVQKSVSKQSRPISRPSNTIDQMTTGLAQVSRTSGCTPVAV